MIFLDNDISLREQVNEDIKTLKTVLKKYSFDLEVMEKIFYNMITSYIDKINFISDGFKLVSSFENSTQKTNVYRSNLEILLKRLEAFKDNGYTNENLEYYYLNKENSIGNDCFDLLNEARRFFKNYDELSPSEKGETVYYIDKIEEIFIMPVTKKEKWEMLRPIVYWLSGRDYVSAVKILEILALLK